MNLICRNCGSKDCRLKPRCRRVWVCQSCGRQYRTGQRKQEREPKLAKRMIWRKVDKRTDEERFGSGLTCSLNDPRWNYFTQGVLERVYMRRGLLI